MAPVKCPSCDKQFPTESFLRNHKKKFHGKESATDQDFKQKSNDQSKDVKQKSNDQPNISNYDLLMETVNAIPKEAKHEEKLYYCDTCSKSFAVESALGRHKTRWHPEKPSSAQLMEKRMKRDPASVKAFECEDCYDSFDLETDMLKHTIKQHWKPNSQDCIICNSYITYINVINMENLKTHMRKKHSKNGNDEANDSSSDDEEEVEAKSKKKTSSKTKKQEFQTKAKNPKG